MKDLSIEEKAKAYDEAIERAKIWKDKSGMPKDKQGILDDIFPELKESEDEKIRKALIFHYQGDGCLCTNEYRIDYKDICAWLEKQVSEPNWCHHKVDLSNCSEEYCKAYYDGWNNCNMQHSQCESERNDVIKCLINGMKFYYEDNEEATWGTDKWSMPVKHIIEVLEKQCEQKPTDVRTTGYWHVEDVEQKPVDKVEPKFKVKYAGMEYNVLEVKDIAGVTYYGIEDEPNHIDYVQTKNCERVGGYSIKENGSPYPTKPAMFSEQKPADKVEPKFHEGDWIVHHGTENVYQVVALIDNQYQLKYGDNYTVQKCDDVDRCARLWDIVKDAKNGDVLAESKNGVIIMFRGIGNPRWDDVIDYHCYYNCCSKVFYVQEDLDYWGNIENNQLKPATKEQRNALMKAITDAGYKWDAEKKELKKIEDENYNGEDYGIDSLFHAQRILEKTLGSVDGYQSDDGILEHKCAISAVKKLVEQKPAWSEEDEAAISRVISIVKWAAYSDHSHPILNDKGATELVERLNSLKDRVQPQTKQEWSEEDENTVASIISSLSNPQLYPPTIHDIEWLKSLKDRVVPQPMQEWSEEDEYNTAFIIETLLGLDGDKEYLAKCKKMANWLKSLRPQKQNITNKDFEDIIREIKTRIAQCNGFNRKHREEVFNLLDSIRPQSHWKPSDEQMEALEHFVRSIGESGYASPYDNTTKLLYSLLADLKKLREE